MSSILAQSHTFLEIEHETTSMVIHLPSTDTRRGLCARLFICALWSPAGKGLTSWLSIVVSNCEFVTFPLVSWGRCGT